jgi:serine/threonine-protein kinase RsbW
MMESELTIPSDLKFLAVVENWLLESLKLELKEDLDWDQVEKRLRLVIVEVYSNIVRHAHQQKPEIPILIRIELQNRTLSLEVWDQGEGFDLNDYKAPDPDRFSRRRLRLAHLASDYGSGGISTAGQWPPQLSET